MKSTEHQRWREEESAKSEDQSTNTATVQWPDTVSRLLTASPLCTDAAAATAAAAAAVTPFCYRPFYWSG